jgi:hypothetical protein
LRTPPKSRFNRTANGMSSRVLIVGLGFAAALGRELPMRRTRFVASTNGGSSSFQPLADAFIQLNRSYNIASAYCSSPGTLTNETVLPSPPFCYENWTLPIKNALGETVYHLPIIQMLGDSGPEKFKIPYIFTKLYVDWAVQWGFDGYLIDAGTIIRGLCHSLWWLDVCRTCRSCGYVTRLAPFSFQSSRGMMQRTSPF